MKQWKKGPLPHDPLVDRPFAEDARLNAMHFTLYMYGYELPVPVADYFCRIFKQDILCKIYLRREFFRVFARYKKKARFIFAPVNINGRLDRRVVLESVKIYRMTEEEYDRLMTDHPEFNGFIFEMDVEDAPEEVDIGGGMRYLSRDSTLMDVTIKMPKQKPG